MDIDGEGADDESGRSVSLSANGQILAIGADGNEDNGVNAGHVRVYQFDGSQWTQIGMDIDGEAAGDESGRSVSLSADGQTLAIGARRNDDNGSNAGHVRVYSLVDPIPTLSHWTLFILGMMLSIVAVVVIRRRSSGILE